MSAHITLSDENLYLLCKEYGEKARFWKRKFMGLLPEVYRRETAARRKGATWLSKKGFSSIFEFAAKLAGVSHEQVRLVLNLERRFEDKPLLKSLLINGEVSANKLIRVAGIATPTNQKMIGLQVQTLSTRALETLVRDYKFMAMSPSMEQSLAGLENKNQNGFQEPLFEGESMRAHAKTYDIGAAVKIVEKLSPEVQKKILELIDKNININQIIEEALQIREVKIAREKEEIFEELEQKQTALGIMPGGSKGIRADEHAKGNPADEHAKGKSTPKSSSRHIPARVIRIINAEQGDKCAVPTCPKRAEVIHHELPFALTKTHNPYNLKKLCKAHHEITHTINMKYYRARTLAPDTQKTACDSG